MRGGTRSVWAHMILDHGGVGYARRGVTSFFVFAIVDLGTGTITGGSNGDGAFSLVHSENILVYRHSYSLSHLGTGH